MRTIIFDFDGTIADSFAAVIGIVYRVTKKEELADANKVHTLLNSHAGLREAIKSLDIPRWQRSWLIKKGRNILAKDILSVPLFEGMDQALVRLSQSKFELYIVSSNSKRNVERFLASRGILGEFKAVYGGAGLFNKDQLIRRVLKSNHLSPKSTVYVGDEVRDIEAAKRVDMPVIAVSWGYNTEKLLLQHQPTVLARSPQQLADIIIGWDEINLTEV